MRVDFDPGVVAPRHRHPGEEIVYVFDGSLEYQLEGQPPKTLTDGDVLFIPAGTIHAVKNVGTGSATIFMKRNCLARLGTSACETEFWLSSQGQDS